MPGIVANLVGACTVWSTDGTRLACEEFNEDDPALDGLFTVRVSDWGDVRRLTPIGFGHPVPGDYSPNSKHLIFEMGDPVRTR